MPAIDETYRLSNPLGLGAIVARLTPEEARLLGKYSIPEGVGRDKITFSTGNLGFFDPSRIVGYECKKCGKEYEGSPAVFVDVDGVEFEMPGDLIGSASYNCKTCNNHIHGAPVLRGDTINPEFVRRDESGEFVKPTLEAIEAELQEALQCGQQAIGGNLDDQPYLRHVNVAERWARKIGYAIPSESVDAIREAHDAAWLEHYQANLKGNLEWMLSDEFAFSLGELDETDRSYFEASGASERFHRFYSALPRLKTDDPEIKRLVSTVLMRYQQMLEENLERKKGQLSELEIEVRQSSEEVEKVKREIAATLKQHGTSKDVEQLDLFAPNAGVNS